MDLPLNMMGEVAMGTPTYPVSSFSSLMAHSSAVSDGSMRPAGTSMVIFSTGGRNCFWRIISGPMKKDAGRTK